MTELQLGTDPATGNFDGTSYEDIAVSKTDHPTTRSSDWYIYRLNVANDGTGGTPQHTGCPCLGDQPLIGADANGFYIITNEFPIFASGFNGAQVYAFDKAALADGTYNPATDLQRIESNGLPLAEGTAYSVQPATSPTAAQWSSADNGTEYFLSALEFSGKLDNRIATWALTNTASLATGKPDVHLVNHIQASEVYGVPPKADQRSGPTPLADALKYNKELLIDTNDDRMNQVVYSKGQLWSGLNTVVKTPHGPTKAGIAYFVVHPTAGGSPTAPSVTSSMTNQGYVAVDRNNVMYPSIGVTPTGTAVMTYSLSGKEYYPSAAITHFNAFGAPTSGVQVFGAGTKPDDGFTGYPAYGGNGTGRWGDYSAAVSDPAGNVWVAAEYIPGTFGYPQFLANWGTKIASVTP